MEAGRPMDQAAMAAAKNDELYMMKFVSSWPHNPSSAKSVPITLGRRSRKSQRRLNELYSRRTTGDTTAYRPPCPVGPGARILTQD